MRDLKKTKELKLEIWGKPDDLYFMQYTLANLLTYQQTTNKKLNYSLVATDNEGKYEVLGTDDTELILQIVDSIKENPWGGK